jgi:nicotinate-nucleotide pyrophosphorylase (carboxylating)
MQGIDNNELNRFIELSLDEDVKDGDHTSLATIDAEDKSKARLIVKDRGVIAGVSFAKAVFDKLDPNNNMEILIEDGSPVSYGDIAFTVECNSRALLMGERLVLNTMQRLSGTASMSRKFAEAVQGLDVHILDTRKTTPLMRFLEKWAVTLGGCENYRIGLYDWIMIKDNHVDACGSHTEAIQKTAQYLKDNNKDLDITVEVRNLDELNEVLKIGQVRRIMLDNFELSDLRKAVEIVGDRFETEASGGVNITTVRPIAETGVNYISVGALTHSAGSLDMSLKVIKDE